MYVSSQNIEFHFRISKELIGIQTRVRYSRQKKTQLLLLREIYETIPLMALMPNYDEDILCDIPMLYLTLPLGSVGH